MNVEEKPKEDEVIRLSIDKPASRKCIGVCDFCKNDGVLTDVCGFSICQLCELEEGKTTI